MKHIENSCKQLSEARAELAQRMQLLEDEVRAAQRRRLPGIKKAAEKVASISTHLKAAIEHDPQLFDSPRTQVFHGIRVGLRKGQGKVVFDNADQTVKLIKKCFPDQVDLLILTEEKPNKEGLEQLPAADLKRVAARIEGTGDQVVIKTTDSAIDKMVNALLKEYEKDEEQKADAA